jgi:diaminopimelate decarboxylase
MDIKNNTLYLGGITAKELVEKYGSPLYVYEEDTVRRRFRDIKENISYPHLRIYYACKANSNLSILRVLREEGAWIDASSPGEVILALKAGFSPGKIAYTSESVTDEEMEFLIKNGILINFSSLSQMERYGTLVNCTSQSTYCNISVRLNPDIGAGHHKHVITGGKKYHFGIYMDQINKIKKIVQKSGLRIIGIHCHIGSGILAGSQFMELVNTLCEIAAEFPSLHIVNFGGGFGIPYTKEETHLDMQPLGEEITRRFKKFSSEYGKSLVMALEPGRYLVAESGILLAEVNTLKRTPVYKFVEVNSGFNHLIRPMAYGAYHEIINVGNVEGEGEKIVVVGNLCESGDIFTQNEDGIEERLIPKIEEGDILAFLNAGAYGFSMSSNYDGRLKPMEVMVRGGESRIIRNRETYDDLLKGME